MQQDTSLLLDVFPRDSFYLAGLNVLQASHSCDYCVARNATLRAARPVPSLRKERLLKDDNQTAQLPVSITGGRRDAATTDYPQSILTSPDPECTVTSGPPPRTLHRTAHSSWSTS